MIISTVLIGCLIILIGVAGLKVYNLSKAGKFLEPIWIFLTLGLCFLALLGILGTTTVTINKAASDETYNSDILEAAIYLDAAWVLIYLNFGLFLGELVMLSGVLFSNDRGRFMWTKPEAR